MDKENILKRLEVSICEMMDMSLHMEEREFAMQRALYLLGKLSTI